MKRSLKNKLVNEYDNEIYVLFYIYKIFINWIKGYDYYEYEFRQRCIHCGWIGFEDEFTGDYYDSYNGTNDCHLCPTCGNDN